MRSSGDPPPPGSLVVREGKPKAFDKVRKELDDDRAERIDEGTWDANYHLSVFAGPPEDGETVELTVNRLFGQHRTVKYFRTASLESLARAGFVMIASPPEPYHYDVVVGTEVDEAVVERFDQCFDEARRNPAWKR